MGLTPELAEAAAAFPGRPVRSYPAVLSTESVAMAWAREGAAHGSLVTAGYQVSPRGRGGLPWAVDPEHDVCFSMVLRPELPPAREGWLYTASACALATLRPSDARIHWPDEVRDVDGRLAGVGAWVEYGPHGISWVVLTMLLTRVAHPVDAVGEAAAEVERRLAAPSPDVLDDYRARCATLGRRVRARMVPLGPAGPQIDGTAADVLADGSLLVDTDRGRRVAIRPQHLGILEDLS